MVEFYLARCTNVFNVDICRAFKAKATAEVVDGSSDYLNWLVICRRFKPARARAYINCEDGVA